MLSHPILIMTVVSTSDANPVALMQQLTATHHSIPGIAQVSLNAMYFTSLAISKDNLYQILGII